VPLPNLPRFLFSYFGILGAGLTMGFVGPALAGAREAGDVPTYVVSLSAAPLATATTSPLPLGRQSR
jgi:hypothetical protein